MRYLFAINDCSADTWHRCKRLRHALYDQIERLSARPLAAPRMTQNQLLVGDAFRPPLRARILRASAWTMTGHIGSQLLRLSSNLIMTRLLVPEMFGVMVLANVILIGLQLFSDLGLGQGIVQSRRGNDLAYLNTVWTAQIIRGGVLWLLAVGIGLALHLLAESRWLPTGSVYADPILPYVVTVLSFSALIGGFVSTRLVTANRNLAMGRITLIELISQASALAIMLVWVLWDRSIWALVVGSLAASTLKVFLSHAILPGEKNTLHWDPEAFREILSFGKWIVLTSILGFLAANGDRLLLGGLTDPATLGLYAIAFFMVSALQETSSKLISYVAFPALSEVARERPEDLKRIYYQFRLPVDVFILLATGALFSAGHLLVDFLYDDRYLGAGHMIEILCIGMFEVRFALAVQCFMAKGKSRLMVPLILIRLLALFGLMPLAYNLYGLDGALWIAGGSALFALPLTIYFKIQNDLFDLKRELAVLPMLGIGYALGIAINQAILLLGWAN